MALSGSLTSSGGYQGRNYTLSWTATQSVANNTSTINWTLEAVGGTSNWYAERTLKVVIAGNTVFTKTNRVERYKGVIKTGSLTLTHDSAGQKSFSASIEATVYYASGINSTGSKTFTLDTIPRKSTLTVGNGTLGTAQALTVTRLSNSFTHTITATCGSASTTICTKSSSTSVSFTPPIAWASQNTTGTSVAVKYTITTYSGSTSVGSNTYSKTCTIPASVVPSCTLSVSDPTGYLTKFGAYIKGKSKFKVTVTPTIAYGSAIASYSTTANGSTYTSASFTTGALNSSGSLTVKATVKDKRGRSGTASTPLTVWDYSAPNVSKLVVRRCDADGTVNDQGECVQVEFSAAVTSLSNKNTASYVLKYKKSSDTSYTSVTLTDYANVYTVTNITYIFPAESGSSYDVQLSITDVFGTVTSNTSASTAFTLMHFKANGTGMGIGKVSELDNVLDIGMTSRFQGGILQPVLKNGADMDDVIVPNTYTGNAVTTSEYLNCPIATATSFTLEVMAAGSAGQVMQRFTSCTKNTPVVYIRHYYSSSWGSWIQIF